MSVARERWLDEGLMALEEGGAAAVRIDRIAARLNLSKGSFHHHFDGAEGYKHALLAHYERMTIAAVDDAISSPPPLTDDRDILGRLIDLIGLSSSLYRPGLDVAVRAWATWDADARATQAAVDAARIGALERVWRTLVADDVAARHSALLPYLVGIGASVVEPAIEAEELRQVYRILLPLIPGA